ncbi:MAG: hypothetical protein ACXWP0_11010 [Ktedonobacterales bacterium]
MAQFTREYKNSNVARKEIQKMARKGFTVVSMTEVQQRSGVGRFLLLGIFAAVFHPKPRVLVVYQGEAAEPKMAYHTLSTVEQMAVQSDYIKKVFGKLFAREAK